MIRTPQQKQEFPLKSIFKVWPKTNPSTQNRWYTKKTRLRTKEAEDSRDGKRRHEEIIFWQQKPSENYDKTQKIKTKQKRSTSTSSKTENDSKKMKSVFQSVCNSEQQQQKRLSSNTMTLTNPTLQHYVLQISMPSTVSWSKKSTINIRRLRSVGWGWDRSMRQISNDEYTKKQYQRRRRHWQ